MKNNVTTTSKHCQHSKITDLNECFEQQSHLSDLTSNLNLLQHQLIKKQRLAQKQKRWRDEVRTTNLTPSRPRIETTERRRLLVFSVTEVATTSTDDVLKRNGKRICSES